MLITVAAAARSLRSITYSLLYLKCHNYQIYSNETVCKDFCPLNLRANQLRWNCIICPALLSVVYFSHIDGVVSCTVHTCFFLVNSHIPALVVVFYNCDTVRLAEIDLITLKSFLCAPFQNEERVCAAISLSLRCSTLFNWRQAIVLWSVVFDEHVARSFIARERKVVRETGRYQSENHKKCEKRINYGREEKKEESANEKLGEEIKTLRAAVENQHSAVRVAMLCHRTDP